MQFNELPLRTEILRAVSELGFENATDIQSGAIPPILEGRDVIGRSSTGTGKTAAFGMPIVEMAANSTEKAAVLILSPTRELAMQTAGELRKFSKYLQGVSLAVLYGGSSMEAQIFQLKNAKIVIGTPGRVMDHLRRKTLKLANLRTVVLDEADEMLNMGFIDDIHSILETAPAAHQTVLFSATMPPAIVKITEEFQTNPVKITVNVGQKTAASIEQSYYSVPQAGKIDALKLLIEYHHPKRSLVFCNTKKMVDELCGSLCDSGFKAVGLHGDLKQSQRNTVMNEFKAGRVNILIATDVAARGIDVDDVEAVFNYDIPQEYEYYIHRIGRTGRAGKAGASYTLAANRNQQYRIREIERYIGAPILEKPVPTIADVSESNRDALTEELVNLLSAGADPEWLAYVRHICTGSITAEELCAVLCKKLGEKPNKRLSSVHNITSSAARSRTAAPGSAGRCWIRASIGSDAKIGPNFIVGALTEASGLPSSVIGRINIYNDHTDIDLPEESAQQILEAMQGTRIKGRDVEFVMAENVAPDPRRRDRPAARGAFGRDGHAGHGAGRDAHHPFKGGHRSFDGDKSAGGKFEKRHFGARRQG